MHESVAAYGAVPRRMTVREYYLAADKGVFRDDERLELLRGEVVRLSPQKVPHAWSSWSLLEALRTVFPRHLVRGHSPFRLDEFNELEPDILVARGPANQYRDRHPGPDDALLVCEIADTSLKKDVGLKAGLYAEFGIPEYWVLDLKGRRLLVFRDPQTGKSGKAAYGVSEVRSPEENAVPTLGNGKGVKVADLLP